LAERTDPALARRASLESEDVFSPSENGISLEGWFIPRPGSDRINIANHPGWFNRSGLQSHLEPWKSLADDRARQIGYRNQVAGGIFVLEYG
jgi:hypothetical protein